MREIGSKRVLVVDDERCVADTLAIIFRQAGYDAVATYDGAAALSACGACAPDLVLSDVNMPGMNGIELAIMIQELYPDCRILLFSGMGGSFELAADAARQGFRFEILQKPTPPAELLQKMAASFRRDPLPSYPQPAAGTQMDCAREA